MVQLMMSSHLPWWSSSSKKILVANGKAQRDTELF